VLAVVVAGLFAVVLLRLWSIQVIGATAARSRALQTVTDTVAIQPPRGSIVLRGGQVLAEDRASNDVLLACPTSDRASCPAADSGVIERLAPLLGTSIGQIDAAVQSNQIAPFVPAPVATGVP
jgi:cell division protein FtsI/penicillin-binding protein 2